MAAPDHLTQLQAELAPEFQIVRLLGEGPMARVYVAREAALRRLVAIKVLNPEVSEDETARKRFERESRSAAKIHHQNVATVHRVGSLEDETPFIIMEYIEGRNLADGLQAEGVMTIEQACHTLSQVASALAAAHEKGIVHRDVKPDNVVRERDSDRVVLTDFGIAGILESGTETISRLTQQGQLLGDPRYTSPEQLLGESVTDESDVYSLGVMGYELLTLKAPYEGTTSVQLVTAHLKKEPIPLLSLRPDADPFLAELLERCLSKNPLHRPRASEVAKALERVTEEPHELLGDLRSRTPSRVAARRFRMQCEIFLPSGLSLGSSSAAMCSTWRYSTFWSPRVFWGLQKPRWIHSLSPITRWTSWWPSRWGAFRWFLFSRGCSTSARRESNGPSRRSRGPLAPSFTSCRRWGCYSAWRLPGCSAGGF